jgi:hypothetical protein
MEAARVGVVAVKAVAARAAAVAAASVARVATLAMGRAESVIAELLGDEES